MDPGQEKLGMRQGKWAWIGLIFQFNILKIFITYLLPEKEISIIYHSN
jgi:hypothetical protein